MLLRAGLVVVAGIVLTFAVPGSAPTHAQFLRTWTGAGGNQLFSNPANWSGNTAPVDGDSVHFTGTGGAVPVTNDIAGLALNRIEFAGSGTFTLSGNSLELNQGVYVDGTAGVGLDISLSGTGGGIVGPLARLTLRADSTFSGLLETFGELHVETPGALGSAAGITRVQGGGTIFIPVSMTIPDEPIHLQGKGTGARANALIAEGEPVTLGNVHVVLETSIYGDELYIPNGIKQAFPGFDLSIEGEVEVGGTTTAEGPIRIASGARLTWNTTAAVDIYLAPGGWLRGSGTVRTIACEQCAVFPITETEISRLTATGAVDLALPDGGLLVILNGPVAGTEYSQLGAGGPITIRDGATVSIQLAVNYEPTVGDMYVIVDNTGAEPIDGVFFGYAEMEVVEIQEGVFARLSYIGGDGNDVVVEIVERDDSPAGAPYELAMPMVARDG